MTRAAAGATAWRRWRANRMAVASGAVFLVVAAACLAGPPIAGAAGLDATDDRRQPRRHAAGRRALVRHRHARAATCWSA